MATNSKSVPLYERLPEIYRIRDLEQPVPYLKAYLGLFEDVFGSLHDNIQQLYRDLFIETCDSWVIPYIGELLGDSVLSADTWTLRAAVADTIALRRRKGTIGAIELLAYDLTKWGAHVTELRENLAWHQHLNHLRPDAGGVPPLSLPGVNRNTVIRGGTVTLRDPAMLSLRGTPFDPYAYTPCLRPPAAGAVCYNLPNLAVFLWRLAAYQAPVTRPVFRGSQAAAAVTAVRFDIHPLGLPVRLFNTARYSPDTQPPVVTRVDETPNAIPPARLTTGAEAGNPSAYVATNTYTPTDPLLADLAVGDEGLQFHLSNADFPNDVWTFRGANLCAWETPLHPPLRDREIAIDPVIGRFVVGVKTALNPGDPDEVAAMKATLISYTYAAPGPVGAHPVSRDSLAVPHATVRLRQNANGLRDALANIQNAAQSTVIEIDDSFVHDLDLSMVAGIGNEGGQPVLLLQRSLVIRASSENRPIVRLAQPLRFRPVNPGDPNVADLNVRLEGVYFTRDAAFPAGEALIERIAVNRLEIVSCTLEPGGEKDRDPEKPRAPILPSLRLRNGYDFTNAAEQAAFAETPEVVLDHSITGPLWIDREYTLAFNACIVDAGAGPRDDGSAAFAISGATNQATDWGPPMQIAQGLTVFGRTRVESATGRGGVFVHRLEVLNNQKGCIKFSYFSGESDRLPQTFDCVRGPDARLVFTAIAMGDPAYAQLAESCDVDILERGPGDDRMGAYGFLLEAHRWKNLQIRIREFLPAGARTLLIAVT